MPKRIITCQACGKEFSFYQRINRNRQFCGWSCYLKQWESLEGRFWRYVKKTETCWVWTRYLDKDGYGQITINRQPIPTHRFSWILHYGKIPYALDVLHRCDNPPCVNPDHLWLGSNSDNIRDAASKGRMARGVKCHSAKLTEDDVRTIRAWYKPGIVGTDFLAGIFGVTQRSIWKLVNRKTWKHI